MGNSSVAQYTNVTVVSTYGGTQTSSGKLFLPKTPEAFSYDPDGNLTNDGRWSLAWDAENRLVSMTSQSSAPTASKLKLEFIYDYQGRRIQKIVSTNDGSIYVPQYTNRFAYDGWNLIATLDPVLGLINSFTWGIDLSGSLEGAGGVGGLVIIRDQSTINNQPSTHFPAFDGNGNAVAIVECTSAETSARFEYGPFGEGFRATGAMAKANPWRFSTKYQDNETGLLYYGHRYYTTDVGRWLNRDRLAESGGANLFAFVRNQPISLLDFLGDRTKRAGPVNLPDPNPDPQERVARIVASLSATLDYPDNTCEGTVKVTAILDPVGNGLTASLIDQNYLEWDPRDADGGADGSGRLVVVYKFQIECGHRFNDEAGPTGCDVHESGQIKIRPKPSAGVGGAEASLGANVNYKVDLESECKCEYTTDGSTISAEFGNQTD